MLSFSKINPMVRAIGTMGAVVAVVGGVTFAQLTTNTVTLASNTISSATAALTIGTNTGCAGNTATTQGFSFTNLRPGVASSPYNFCLDNTGTVPLALTALIPGDFTGSGISPADVTLGFTCTSNQSGTITDNVTVAQLNSGPQPFASTTASLAAGDVYSCAVTATLASTVTGGTLTPFNLTFTGTDATPASTTGGATVTGTPTGTPITPGGEDQPADQ